MIIQELGKTGRKSRRPQHSWNVRHKPFVIQPFMIAPVLPGETLKNLLLQARCVTAPIKNPLIGWWMEHYVFYVKHRDLDDRDDFTQMVLQHNYDLSSLNSAADPDTYHGATGLDWTKKCLQRVVTEYFRDEGEDHTDHVIDGNPIAKASGNAWFDSMIADSAFTSGEGSETADTADAASDLEILRTNWEFLRAQNLTTMDYEDFLRTYGVRTSASEHHRPELIRYSRDWQYPSNTVDPTDGSVASAVSWAVSERADKDRFFKEPGFIFGVTIARPKVYMSKQTSAGVSMLTNALSWLPAIMRDEPATSLRAFASGSGPIGASSADYWVDVRDLFMYGDQFVNFALTETDAGLVALPTVDMSNHWFVSDTDVTTGLHAGTDYLVKQDGVCSLNILGTQQDHTPTMTSVR